MNRILVIGASLAGLRAAAALRAQGHDGELTVVGDEPHPPYDRPPLSKELRVVDLPVDGSALDVRLGHWTDAVEQAHAAAHALLHPADPRPFTEVPSFWSDLHGVRLRSVGLPALADEVRIIEYDLPRRRMEAVYYRRNHLVAALTINRPARLAAYRRQLHDGLLSSAA